MTGRARFVQKSLSHSAPHQTEPVPKIDVLLYSTGGHTLAAWGLANLVREYCNEVAVLIPHRALSAATLFTLSANEIIMSRLGQLTHGSPKFGGKSQMTLSSGDE